MRELQQDDLDTFGRLLAPCNLYLKVGLEMSRSLGARLDKIKSFQYMDCSEQWTNFPPNASQQTWEIFIQWRDIVSSDACHYKLLPFTTCDSVTKTINSFHHSGGSMRWLKQDDSANCNQQHLLMLPFAGLCSCWVQWLDCPVSHFHWTSFSAAKWLCIVCFLDGPRE